MNFTLASIEEFDLAWSLIEEVLSASDGDGVFYAPSKESLARDINNGSTYFIYDSGELLGSIVINNIFGSYVPKGVKWLSNRPFLIIHRVCIRPTMQGKGIGTRILDMVEREFVDESICSLRLDVFSANQGAVRLYERLGYELVAISGSDEGEVYMYEKLIR